VVKIAKEQENQHTMCSAAAYSPSFIHSQIVDTTVRTSWPRMLLLTVLAGETNNSSV
jgi:hypothetical protein